MIIFLKKDGFDSRNKLHLQAKVALAALVLGKTVKRIK